MLEKFNKYKVENPHQIKGSEGSTNGVYRQTSVGYKGAAYLNFSIRND